MSEYLTIDHLTRNEIRRLFTKIEVDPITKCWNWTGALDGKGYGMIYYKGHREKTHRLIYAWINGKIQRGCSYDVPVIDHICDNVHCCNPSHLEQKTHRDNILRGNGACAINSKKTVCPNGHQLPATPDIRYGPSRRCQICLTEKRRKNVIKKREYDRIRRKHICHLAT